jgi:hypothetical protein
MVKNLPAENGIELKPWAKFMKNLLISATVPSFNIFNNVWYLIRKQSTSVMMLLPYWPSHNLIKGKKWGIKTGRVIIINEIKQYSQKGWVFASKINFSTDTILKLQYFYDFVHN